MELRDARTVDLVGPSKLGRCKSPQVPPLLLTPTTTSPAKEALWWTPFRGDPCAPTTLEPLWRGFRIKAMYIHLCVCVLRGLRVRGLRVRVCVCGKGFTLRSA